MNEYDAHLGSYDHSHRQRLKDMRNMVKDPNAAERARKAEAKEAGFMSIKLSGQSGGSGGFKKGGFKKSGFKSAFTPAESSSAPASTRLDRDANTNGAALTKLRDVDSDTEDEGDDIYDPRLPTD